MVAVGLGELGEGVRSRTQRDISLGGGRGGGGGPVVVVVVLTADLVVVLLLLLLLLLLCAGPLHTAPDQQPRGAGPGGQLGPRACTRLVMMI